MPKYLLSVERYSSSSESLRLCVPKGSGREPRAQFMHRVTQGHPRRRVVLGKYSARTRECGTRLSLAALADVAQPGAVLSPT